ncbi:MAG: hypothetical protein ACRD01_08910 [Terriglobales bacterium]
MQLAVPKSHLDPAPPRRRWRRQLGGALESVVAVEVGLLLLALPWTSLWSHSYWALYWPASHPRLWALSMSPYLRGAISGLGLVNIWCGTSLILPLRG